MAEKDPDIATLCPYCRRPLIRYHSSHWHHLGNSCYELKMYGNCPQCWRQFTWEEKFRIYLSTEPKEIEPFSR